MIINWKSFFISIFFFMFFSVTTAKALTTPHNPIVSCDKVWTVKFNESVNSTYLNENYIHVIDKNNNKVSISISSENDNKTIYIKPISSYIPGEEYCLVIKDLKSSRGQLLKESISMKFNTILPKEFSVREISIGDSFKTVESTLGKPDRIDVSRFGFQWYIYNADYSKFAMIGIKDNTVAGIYSNTVMENHKGISIGMSKKIFENAYGMSLPYLPIAGTNLSNKSYSDTIGIYPFEDFILCVYYDAYRNYALSAIEMISYDIYSAMDSYYGTITEEVVKANELEAFDLINSERTKFNFPQLEWDEFAYNSAKFHSLDMIKNGFFDYKGSDNNLIEERLTNSKVNYSFCKENISFGQFDAIEAHADLMNSLEHRSNILNPTLEKLGVGIAYKKFNNSNMIHSIKYTYDFYSTKPSAVTND